jgi:hypothetical protein
LALDGVTETLSALRRRRHRVLGQLRDLDVVANVERHPHLEESKGIVERDRCVVLAYRPALLVVGIQ